MRNKKNVCGTRGVLSANTVSALVMDTAQFVYVSILVLQSVRQRTKAGRVCDTNAYAVHSYCIGSVTRQPRCRKAGRTYKRPWHPFLLDASG